MGKTASKLKGAVIRPVKNYNLESRAFKEISKEKPTQAPTYPSLEKVMRDIKNDPDLLTKRKFTADEIKNLSQVHVTSTGTNPVLKSSKKLPENRTASEPPLFGVMEPVNVPPGKLSPRQLLALLGKHASDPKSNTPKVLAAEFNLDVKTTTELTEHFRTFVIYTDPNTKSKTLDSSQMYRLVEPVPPKDKEISDKIQAKVKREADRKKS